MRAVERQNAKGYHMSDGAVIDYVLRRLAEFHYEFPELTFESAVRLLRSKMPVTFRGLFFDEAEGSAVFSGYKAVVGEDGAEVSVASVLMAVTIDVMRKYALEDADLKAWAAIRSTYQSEPDISPDAAATVKSMRNAVGPS